MDRDPTDIKVERSWLLKFIVDRDLVIYSMSECEQIDRGGCCDNTRVDDCGYSTERYRECRRCCLVDV